MQFDFYLFIYLFNYFVTVASYFVDSFKQFFETILQSFSVHSKAAKALMKYILCPEKMRMFFSANFKLKKRNRADI